MTDKVITQEQINQIDWLISQACFPTVNAGKVGGIWNILGQLEDCKEEELLSQIESKEKKIQELQTAPIEN